MFPISMSLLTVSVIGSRISPRRASVFVLFWVIFRLFRRSAFTTLENDYISVLSSNMLVASWRFSFADILISRTNSIRTQKETKLALKTSKTVP